MNKQKIGLVGHSEGGIIAPMVGARSPAVAFMVLLAGSAVPGDEIIVAQSSLIAEASGMPREMADANVRNLRSILDVVKRKGDEAAVNAKIQEVFGGQLPPAAAAQLKALTTPWFRYFITYDPAPTLRLVKQPVLAMNGEKDLQVPSKQNLDAIRGALTAGGNTRIDIVELPGLNHLFQTAKTGVARGVRTDRRDDGARSAREDFGMDPGAIKVTCPPSASPPDRPTRREEPE